MSRVALVTGANKGIGLAIVEQLLEQIDGTVILAARDEERGKAAVNSLLVKQSAQKANLEFHQLDITDNLSIERIKKHLVEKHGGLDVLVNNAGIAYKGNSTAPFAEQAEVTVKTNYTGTLQVCQALFPILRPFARVATVASLSGLMRGNYSNDWIERFSAEDLTLEQLTGYTEQFIQAARDDQVRERGFRKSAYGLSKAAVIAMTKVQAREMAKDSRENILVNCCCPGYVATDMSSHKGTLTTAQGAITPVYLSLLPPGTKSPQGEFVYLKKPSEWP